jgi:hypothetical protein
MYASLLRRREMPITDVAKPPGHSSTQVAVDLYGTSSLKLTTPRRGICEGNRGAALRSHAMRARLRSTDGSIVDAAEPRSAGVDHGEPACLRILQPHLRRPVDGLRGGRTSRATERRGSGRLRPSQPEHLTAADTRPTLLCSRRPEGAHEALADLGAHVIVMPRRASSPSRSSARVPAGLPSGTVQKISNSSPSGSLA